MRAFVRVLPGNAIQDFREWTGATIKYIFPGDLARLMAQIVLPLL